MMTSIIMNVINIICNVFLIHGFGPIPPLGVLGVTISTNSSKVLGLLLILYFFRRFINLPLSFKYLRPFPKKLCTISSIWVCLQAVSRFRISCRRW